MNLNEFASECAKYVELKLGTAGKVEVTKVTKNNGVCKTAIVINRDKGEMSPTIYIEEYFDMFKNGIPFEELINHMYDVYCNSLDTQTPDLNIFNSFDSIKHKLMCKLINKEKNQKLLEEAPHVDCLDLSIVFYAILEVGNGQNGTVIIKNEHIRNWAVSLNDIYEVALINTRKELGTCIWNIEDVLLDMINHSVQSEERKEDIKAMLEEDMSNIKASPMYVMSNKSKCLGAACMLDEDTLKQFSERINSSFYIIPSSIHELILVPDDNNPLLKEQLLDMVIEVNATQLAEDEFLANQVYKFSKELGKVTFA